MDVYFHEASGAWCRKSCHRAAEPPMAEDGLWRICRRGAWLVTSGGWEAEPPMAED